MIWPDLTLWEQTMALLGFFAVSMGGLIFVAWRTCPPLTPEDLEE